MENKQREWHIQQFIDIFGIEDYEVHYTCDKPFLENVSRHMPKYEWFLGNNCDDQEYYRQLDCLYNHYGIIKCALNQGVEYLMVVEDDVIPEASKQDLENALEQLPDDWDIAQFNPINKHVDGWPLWNLNYQLPPDNAKWGTQMYILNRNGMQFYIDFVDSYPGVPVADLPLIADKTECAHYVYNGHMITTLFNDSIIHERRDSKNTQVC